MQRRRRVHEVIRYDRDPGVGDPRKLYREVEDKVRALLAETGFGDRAEPLIRATATLTHAPRVTALAELVS
jgi:hypothetical protein